MSQFGQLLVKGYYQIKYLILTVSSLFNQNELICQTSNGRVRASGDLMSAPLIRAM